MRTRTGDGINSNNENGRHEEFIYKNNMFMRVLTVTFIHLDSVSWGPLLQTHCVGEPPGATIKVHEVLAVGRVRAGRLKICH